MSAEEDEFLKSLRATFKIEAGEHLQAIATGLLALEKTPVAEEQRQLVESVFRAAHSLKGAARSVNFSEIETICQSVEDMFAIWKRGESAASPEALDKVHRALDEMSHLVDVEQSLILKPSSLPQPPISRPAVTVPSLLVSEAVPSEKPAFSETVRIAVSKLDAQLLEAEEMLAAKLVSSQRAFELGALASQIEEWQKECAKLQPHVRALSQAIEQQATAPGSAVSPGMPQLADFFDWNHDYLRSIENKVASLRRAAEQDRMTVGKLVDDLLENSKSLLRLPFATLSALFPKLVRDLCRCQGKEADLVMRGEEVELDKRILEEVKDPIIHLLRNCVDHGIESPEQRKRLGKPPRATITFTVSPVNGSKVELIVSDDGAGIDIAKVKASAIKNNFITLAEADRMNELDALALIFRADVSTSPIITQLSGRGLGLAIVREKTEKLGGRVSVESGRNVGTTIRITLPVALATFRGILIEVADRLFIVPTAQVERVTRFKPAEVQTVEGRETLALNGRAVALARLADVLDLPGAERNGEPSAYTSAVVIGGGEQQVALAVDAVLDEQEVLVKRLNKPLVRVRNIAGATTLGSGQVVPVLNGLDLLRSASKHGGARRVKTPAMPPAATAKSVLVAEDSITSRMLLKGILESAGFQVKTAVDGAEAFTMLRSERFDLVVSDVEMPRMNGFDLTARIRADKRLAETPVVLVTALEMREDRERGVDVGANAYLVKSSFDQSNLLETVKRLV